MNIFMQIIRPDAPGTQPGEPGNGHVLVIDADHQMFGGLFYTRRILNNGKTEKYSCTSMGRRYYLHNEVWMFHNGELPDGYVIHHEHRKPNGKFDSDMNDIEWLFLMKQSEHVYYHHVADPYIEKTCKNPKCGKKFLAPSYGNEYCCKKCSSEARNERVNIARQSKFVTPEIAATLEEDIALARDFAIDAGYDPHVGALETRFCYYCHRPFTTAANSLTPVCTRPDCKGRALMISFGKMQHLILERIAARNKLRTFYNEQFGKLDVYLDDDGVPWFVGKQVAEMIGYKNSRKAIRDHVESEDKREERIVTPSRNGGVQTMILINEYGMNDLILDSELPAAKKIRHWISHEVMPKLRRTGLYAFVDEPPLLSKYFTEEELQAAYDFREMYGGSIQALADLNRLSDAERQLGVQMIKMLVNRHEEPSIIAEAAKNA